MELPTQSLDPALIGVILVFIIQFLTWWNNRGSTRADSAATITEAARQLVEEYQEQVQLQKLELEKLELRFNVQERELASLRVELDTHRETISNLEAELKTRDELVTSLERDFAQLRQKYDALMAEYKALKQQSNDISKKIETGELKSQKHDIPKD